MSALLQLVVSLGGAGLLVQLLLLRANRRKIAGEATSSEANAASTLSGAALKMVESAQRSQHEAEKRADEADTRIASVRVETQVAWQEVTLLRRTIHGLEQYIDQLITALRRSGHEVPPMPEEHPQEHLPQQSSDPSTPPI